MRLAETLRKIEIITNKVPYLSVVVCTRNDDHGGGLLERTQLFVDSFTQQCEKYKIESELIIVEWNPPPQRNDLQHSLKWPKDREWCSIRIIGVPERIHKRFGHSAVLPLFQMIAKNVGIRAASGEFVLATNVDLLFSDSLMKYIGEKNLRAGNLYRVDRYDVPPKVQGENLNENLSFCRRNSLRVCKINGTYYLTGEFDRVYPEFNPHYPNYFLGLVGVTQFGYIIPRRLFRRLATSEVRSTRQASLPIRDRIAISLYTVAKRVRMPRHRGELKTIIDAVVGVVSTPVVRLHTNACGDFTLMAREDWFRIRGYAESEMFSLHLDSLLLYSAHFAGIREIYLKDPIYHMDHSLGWAEGVRNADLYFHELDRKGVPYLKSEDFLDLVARMAIDKRRNVFNGMNWGLANEPLTEILVGSTKEVPSRNSESRVVNLDLISK